MENQKLQYKFKRKSKSFLHWLEYINSVHYRSYDGEVVPKISRR